MGYVTGGPEDCEIYSHHVSASPDKYPIVITVVDDPAIVGGFGRQTIKLDATAVVVFALSSIPTFTRRRGPTRPFYFGTRRIRASRPAQGLGRSPRPHSATKAHRATTPPITSPTTSPDRGHSNDFHNNSVRFA
jgi:hypothetical protein